MLLAAVVLHIWAAWQLTADEPRGAARRATSQRDEVHDHLRLAHHALGRRDHPALRRLPPAPLHLGHASTPTSSRGTSTTTSWPASSVWWVSLFYIVAMVALGLHLYHGVWSMFQSLGWNHPRYNPWRRGFAHAFAWIVTLGNISFPLAVLTGLVR